MNLQQLNDYMDNLTVTTGVESLSDSEIIKPAGFVTEVILDDDTMIADAKLLVERYLKYEGPYSEDDFDNFVEKFNVFELEHEYEGIYEFNDCFYVDVTPDYDNLSEKQYWFSVLFLYFVVKYFTEIPSSLLKDIRKCSRCQHEVFSSSFFDRGMCAPCLRQVFGAIIDTCQLCCDVNYINSSGRCVVCDYYSEDDDPNDDEHMCSGCGNLCDLGENCGICGYMNY